MTRWVVGTAVDAWARRHRAPDDLGPLTDVGAEPGAADPVEAEAAATVWSAVEDLYRTGMHPGIQVCVRHRGEVVLERSLGHARGVDPSRPFDPDHASPMTVDTPVNLFSASKAVSAMLIHLLAERGTLSLDDPVADHVPAFARHGKGDITISQVLSHQAGVPLLPPASLDLDVLADTERVDELVYDLRITAAIGGAPAYHALTGGFVLDMVARHTDGRNLRQLLEEEVRRPLGLGRMSLGVDPADVDLVAENVETGFAFLLPLDVFFHRALGAPWSRLLRMSNDPRFLTASVPSGNIVVTARDAAAFYQCLLDGGALDGTRIFATETIERAREPRVEGTPFDRLLGLPMRYSEGFMLGAEGLTLYGWHHPDAFGHLGMSNLLTWAEPSRDLVVAILTTGKPMIGPHVLAFPRLIGALHDAYSAGDG